VSDRCPGPSKHELSSTTDANPMFFMIHLLFTIMTKYTSIRIPQTLCSRLWALDLWPRCLIADAADTGIHTRDTCTDNGHMAMLWTRFLGDSRSRV
jgi:hypothetical protein